MTAPTTKPHYRLHCMLMSLGMDVRVLVWRAGERGPWFQRSSGAIDAVRPTL